MKRTFTTLFAAFSACLLCSVGAKAAEVSGTYNATESNIYQLEFVIDYPQAIKIAGEADASNLAAKLNSDAQLKASGSNITFTATVEADNQIKFVGTQNIDNKSALTLTLPKICDLSDNTTAAGEGQTISFGTVNVDGTVSPASRTTPKPAFIIEYPDKITLSDAKINSLSSSNRTKFNNEPDIQFKGNYLAASSQTTLTANGSPIAFITNVIENKAGSAKVSFIAEELVYFPSGASVSLTLPTLRVGKINQTTAPTFNFTIDTYTTYENGNTLSPDANTSVVVKSGSVLKVSSNINCKQLIVENGAGVVIDKGATLTVADTAFYLTAKYDVQNMGYLINKGTYIAEASVFNKFIPTSYTKNAVNYNYYSPVSIPVNKMKYKDMSISRVSLTTGHTRFYESFIYYGVDENGNKNIEEEEYDYQAIAEAGSTSMQTSNDDFEYDAEPRVFYMRNNQDKVDVYPCIFRSKAEKGKNKINNDKGYLSHPESQGVHPPVEFERHVKINNPYQAPVDWRSIEEHGRADVNSVYINNINCINNYSIYNPYSGVTTYDGPMEYGYLQPHLTHATLQGGYASESAEDNGVQIARADLLSYAEVVDRYKDVTPNFPYIRFYCDNETSKGEGNRNVCVVYFMPKSDVTAKAREQYDAKFVVEETDLDLNYPCIVAQKGAGNSFMSIASEALPTEDSESTTVDFHIFNHKAAEAENNDNVVVGILDYYLPYISIESVEFGGSDVTLTYNEPLNIHKDDGSWSDRTFAGVTAGSVDLTISFKYDENANPTAIKEVETADADIDFIVRYQNGAINVSGIADGSICNLYNINGVNLISKKSELGSVNFDISVKGVYFVEIINNDSRAVKKIVAYE